MTRRLPFQWLQHRAVGESATPFPGLLHLLLMRTYNFECWGSIKYHFLSLFYDSTSDWTLVLWTIDEHFNHYANGPVLKNVERFTNLCVIHELASAVHIQKIATIYIYIYRERERVRGGRENYRHHQVVLWAQSSPTLFRHPFLSSIPSAKSSRLHPVSPQNRCWLANTGTSMCKSLKENVASEFVLAYLGLFILFGWLVWWEVSGRTTVVLLDVASRIRSKQHVTFLSSSYQAFSLPIMLKSRWCRHSHRLEKILFYFIREKIFQFDLPLPSLELAPGGIGFSVNTNKKQFNLF